MYIKEGRSNICNEVRKNRTRSKMSKLYVKYVKNRKSRNSEKQYINIRSMHQVRSKRYRLHQCVWYVYTEPALRVTDTQTHKCTVMCTVSSWKHSGNEKKQKEPMSQVYVHIKYISCILVRFGSNMCNVKSPCKIDSLSERKCQRKIKRLSNIECAKWVNGEPKESYKTVSGDYEIFSVLSKMEAKSEDGPEMDVDGITPDEQNGKKCNGIYCCGPLSSCTLCMQLLSNDNVVSVKPLFHIEMIARIHIPPHCRILILILILTRYMYNIAQSLTMLLSAIKYVIAPFLPYEPCYMISKVYRELFRTSRYRE